MRSVVQGAYGIVHSTGFAVFRSMAMAKASHAPGWDPPYGFWFIAPFGWCSWIVLIFCRFDFQRSVLGFQAGAGGGLRQ